MAIENGYSSPTLTNPAPTFHFPAQKIAIKVSEAQVPLQVTTPKEISIQVPAQEKVSV